MNISNISAHTAMCISNISAHTAYGTLPISMINIITRSNNFCVNCYNNYWRLVFRAAINRRQYTYNIYYPYGPINVNINTLLAPAIAPLTIINHHTCDIATLFSNRHNFIAERQLEPSHSYGHYIFSTYKNIMSLQSLVLSRFLYLFTEPGQ